MRLLQTTFYVNVDGIPMQDVGEYIATVRQALGITEADKRALPPHVVERRWFIPVRGIPTSIKSTVINLGND